jgi:hypothetical protein
LIAVSERFFLLGLLSVKKWRGVPAPHFTTTSMLVNTAITDHPSLCFIPEPVQVNTITVLLVEGFRRGDKYQNLGGSGFLVLPEQSVAVGWLIRRES